jgi:hypothetical protein
VMGPIDCHGWSEATLKVAEITETKMKRMNLALIMTRQKSKETLWQPPTIVNR